jgi:hypothetical protein
MTSASPGVPAPPSRTRRLLDAAVQTAALAAGPTASQVALGDQFEALVEQNRVALNAAPNAGVYIGDRRSTYTTTRKPHWWSTPVPEQHHPTIRVSPPVRASFATLVECQSRVKVLTLPSSHPLPDQVDAAVLEVCALAASICNTFSDGGVASKGARASVPHHTIVDLAARIAALVTLAERRERVLHSIDTESLNRTAQALNADLTAARALLHVDPLDT